METYHFCLRTMYWAQGRGWTSIFGTILAVPGCVYSGIETPFFLFHCSHNCQVRTTLLSHALELKMRVGKWRCIFLEISHLFIYSCVSTCLCLQVQFCMRKFIAWLYSIICVINVDSLAWLLSDLSVSFKLELLLLSVRLVFRKLSCLPTCLKYTTAMFWLLAL